MGPSIRLESHQVCHHCGHRLCCPHGLYQQVMARDRVKHRHMMCAITVAQGKGLSPPSRLIHPQSRN
eukprot:4644213-Amphidinium_carterae.1